MKTITFPFSLLTATIQPSKPVILTYNANGGSGSIPNVVVNTGTPIVLSDGSGLTPPEEGQSFICWTTTAGGNTPVSSPLTITEDTTIYAKWAIVVEDPDDNNDEGVRSVKKKKGV